MDKSFMRNQALQAAQQNAKVGASLKAIMKDADEVFAWLSQDGEASAPATSATHESEAAVAGQEPKD